MRARERILMIRLMEKKYATYAKTLGVEATGAVKSQNMKSDSKGLTSV